MEIAAKVEREEERGWGGVGCGVVKGEKAGSVTKRCEMLVAAESSGTARTRVRRTKEKMMSKTKQKKKKREDE